MFTSSSAVFSSAAAACRPKPSTHLFTHFNYHHFHQITRSNINCLSKSLLSSPPHLGRTADVSRNLFRRVTSSSTHFSKHSFLHHTKFYSSMDHIATILETPTSITPPATPLTLPAISPLPPLPSSRCTLQFRSTSHISQYHYHGIRDGSDQVMSSPQSIVATPNVANAHQRSHFDGPFSGKIAVIAEIVDHNHAVIDSSPDFLQGQHLTQNVYMSWDCVLVLLK
ncbi:hypothetical protein K435DRAFT_874402 [Dendrothele bispora CBS 962.96]|uniref:Uncharacterized protein n=1 Tax=Dendrothele bispora (strain CBS 962.96) TaxID=1314807 RepID=A0A4S8KX39_DENBC|nr:hypothetical protein K435DRAFT_874402 [Dendrothele bispora CBS 962.96]